MQGGCKLEEEVWVDQSGKTMRGKGARRTGKVHNGDVNDELRDLHAGDILFPL